MAQDKINTATAGYMEAERQQENTVFLAPVGLSYEFVHNVADLADFAHGQDRGAPFAERMLALIGNPYASILKLCKSKQSMMDNARAGLGNRSATTSVADAGHQSAATTSANSEWTAGRVVSGDAANESQLAQIGTSAKSGSPQGNTNGNRDGNMAVSNSNLLKANLVLEPDFIKAGTTALGPSTASSARWRERHTGMLYAMPAFCFSMPVRHH